ncbi:MAG TPA: CFI-box-CTERM domain-containing protein, partial [Nitrosopumilaceae archaeon]|nr:CFI-box-CTERM domain-containing protein [Nitrosopumilaceae archaeon]
GILEMISDGKVTINGKAAWEVEALGKFQSGPNLLNVRFAEVIFPTSKTFYVITYTNSEEDFENYVKDFENAIDSFTLLSEEKEMFSLSSTGEESTEGGGCLIATATFGSELTPQVQQLRELRDGTILNTESGIAFMESFNTFYYLFSPTIADWERENPAFKEAVKLGITPMLMSFSILNHVDIDSEAEMLGYGIGIILMNVGMYFVAPAIIIHRLRK